MSPSTFFAPRFLLAALAAGVADSCANPSVDASAGPRTEARADAEANAPRTAAPAAPEPAPPQRPKPAEGPVMKPQVGNPELGFLGYQPPEVAAVVFPDAVPHQDTTGGGHQVLTAATGGPGGFAVAWRDPRDGSTGLYILRLDADLVPREPERSASKPHTMRRTDPSLALGADGALAVTWTGVIGKGSIPFLRLFDAQGRDASGEMWAAAPVMLDAGEEQRGSGDDVAVSCRLPDVLQLGGDRTVVAWTRQGRVQVLELGPDSDRNARPPAAPIDVDQGSSALAGVHLCADPEGTPACLWSVDKKGVMLSVRRGKGFATRAVGVGIGDELAVDPRGGWWVLARTDAGSVLRRVTKDLRVDGADLVVANGRVVSQDLAVVSDGVAVLVTTNASDDALRGTAPRQDDGRGAAPRQDDGRGAAPRQDAAGGPPVRTRLHLFDPDGVRRADVGADGLDVVPESGNGALLAGDGRRLLVAWTDMRTGEGDVYGRRIDPHAAANERMGPEKRLNTDVASADQVQPAVAAAGDRALVTWIDRRSIPARVFVRRLSRTGFDGDELALPLAFGQVPAPAPVGGVNRPAAALTDDGDALVVWRTAQGRGKGRILGQIVGVDRAARSPVLVFDDGAEGEVGDAVVVALRGDRGFLVVWPRAGAKGVWCRRVTAQGELTGVVRRVNEPGDRLESDVAAARLDDGRVVTAWNSEIQGGAIAVRGRILRDNGEAAGDEIAFEPSRPVSEWDPALAPAGEGGFVMAWTSGARTDPVRDVVVRLFDAQGRPRHTVVTPCLGANEQDFADVCRLADGTFAVAWEDDVSYADQCYVRRVSADGARIGRMCRLNQEETKHMPDRVAPRIVRFGDGFLTAFGDRRRSQGFDVRVKIVGAAFDVGLPPDPPAKEPPQ